MHYYHFHIGDYSSHTRHLTVIEDIAYRRMLDFYYLHEQPINPDKIARMIGMKEYKDDVAEVLDEFFEKTDRGYINQRADEEIAQYREFIEAGKRGAAKRWGKDQNRGNDGPPNKEGNTPPKQGAIPTIPITHNPVTNSKSRGTTSVPNPGFSDRFVVEVWPFFAKNKKGAYKNIVTQGVAIRKLFELCKGNEADAVEALRSTLSNNYQGFDWWFDRKRKEGTNGIPANNKHRHSEFFDKLVENVRAANESRDAAIESDGDHPGDAAVGREVVYRGDAQILQPVGCRQEG
jgi:uncharacterized protein YdaU (DUF1376 family)